MGCSLRSWALALLASLTLALPAQAWVHGAASGSGPTAPTVVLSDPGTHNNGVAVQITGGCAAGSTAVLFAFNNTGKVFTTVTDSVGNTWTIGTVATQGVNRLVSFRSLLTSTLVAASSTITVNFASGTDQPSVIAQCSNGAFDSQGADNGAGSQSGGYSTTVGSTVSASQVILAIFQSNRWSNMTPNPPNTGWTAAGTALASVNFGIETFYKNVGASSTDTATFTGGASTTAWVASWVAVH